MATTAAALPDLSNLSPEQLAEVVANATRLQTEKETTKRTAFIERVRGMAEKDNIPLSVLAEAFGGKPARPEGGKKRKREDGMPHEERKYYDPKSGKGWNGVGKPPKFAQKPDGTRDDEGLLRFINPKWKGGEQAAKAS